MNKFHGRISFRRNNSLYFAIFRVFPIVQIDEHSTNAVYAIDLVLYCRVGKWLYCSDTNSEAVSSGLTCGACFFFVIFFFFFFCCCCWRIKYLDIFSTSFPCKVKLSFYPNNYLSFTEI